MSERFVHSAATLFAAAEFEILVIGLFIVVAFALKFASVDPDPTGQTFSTKPYLARDN